MNILDVKTINNWRVAKKTKSLRAKPMVCLLVDSTVMSKFLVDTMEAREPVSASAMFCIGETNDAWQQTSEKLLAKYTVEEIDEDGWMVCVPRPDNSVEFYEVVITDVEFEWDNYIVGQWGATIDGVQNLQKFETGDFIARNRTDTDDVWVVARKIWLNSYTEISG